ncbi:putative kelch repeat and BTB domain-containing protein 5/10 [Monocercomonoides exilis]|uniref:putative kelch repeat and BTB domain-containing protein 5/10 n=1 Tax=Monocercomonoides exilis TaxID=2049356 RepID=UPI00355A2500|nr:putative kelch repeat and BTB domain-containing protein 5/10 [Monocercomonoides exilis]|eukprot:MONOS_971.1-p1 / transcript=MONOS_971.1 / gene=MONOS_971 / organism=Monocercomonoides_exilis_PA203 / gene_product=unspecified product / transcript_product=unspecified product / location=Mono_scaffold00016:105073-109816(-) / protein_length=1545 / sequence_SO=supercontig / SO=protein_coding / is_pseudo=false
MQLAFHFTLLLIINALFADADPQVQNILAGFGKSPAGGSPPSPRQNAILIRPSFTGCPKNLFYCFSGIDGKKQYLQDVMSFIYTSGSMDWRPVEINGINTTPQRVEYSYYVDDTDFVIWGGMGPDGFYDDMWAFNMQTKVWSEVFQSHERPSARQAAHFCKDGEYFYIFGGRTNDGKTNDVWKFHIPTRVWTRLLGEVDIKTYTDAPATRSGGGAFASGSYLYIFGGYTSKSKQSQDVYRIPVDNPTEGDWKHLPLVERGTTTEINVVPRTEAGICWDGNYVYLFGGLHEETTSEEMANDLLVLDFTKNVANAGLMTVEVVVHALHDESYQRRAGGFVICDEESTNEGEGAVVTRRGFAFGGTRDGDILGNLDRITLDANDISAGVKEWTRVSETVSNIPSPRALHGVVGALGRLWVYGGQGTGGAVLNDLYSYDIATKKWHKEEPTGGNTETPPALYDFGMCEHSGRLFIFGGIGVDLVTGVKEVKNDIWEYSITDHSWSKMKPLSSLKPLGRSGCYTKILHKNLIVVGGRMSDGSVSNQIWVFSLMSWKWKIASTRYRPQLHTNVSKIFEKGEFDETQWMMNALERDTQQVIDFERREEYDEEEDIASNNEKSKMSVYETPIKRKVEKVNSYDIGDADDDTFSAVPPYILEKRDDVAIHSKEMKIERDGKTYEVDQIIIAGGVSETRESSITLDYLILPDVGMMKDLGAKLLDTSSYTSLISSLSSSNEENNDTTNAQSVTSSQQEWKRPSRAVVADDSEQREFLVFYGDPLPEVPYPNTQQEQYAKLPIHYRSYTAPIEDGFLSFSGLDVDTAKCRVNHWILSDPSKPVFEYYEGKDDLTAMAGGGAAYYKNNLYCFGGNIIGNKLPADNQFHNQLLILHMTKNFTCSPGTKKVETKALSNTAYVGGSLPTNANVVSVTSSSSSLSHSEKLEALKSSKKPMSTFQAMVAQETFQRMLHNSNMRTLSSLWIWDNQRRYTSLTDLLQMEDAHSAFSSVLSSSSLNESASSSYLSYGEPSELAFSLDSESEFCVFCPTGQFAKKFNSVECTKCNPGSYNNYEGGLSGYHCVACPANTYNDESGRVECKPCPKDSYCPVGSKSSNSTRPSMDEQKDEQPPFYETNDKFSLFITIGCYVGGAIVGVCVSFMCICLPTRGKLFKLDLFSDRHSNKLDPITNTAPKVLKKSRIGGFVSIMYLCFAVCAAVSVVVEFLWNNVTETKSVIAASMEPSLDLTSIVMRSFRAEITLRDYCGECVNGIPMEDVNTVTDWLDCHPKFYLSTRNLASVTIDKNTKARTYHDLKVQCKQQPSVNDYLNPVKNCIVKVTGDNVEFAFKEDGSYPMMSVMTTTDKAHAYALEAKVSVDTGIGFGWKGKKGDLYKRLSTRTLVAQSSSSQPFKGAQSTVFRYNIMPSMFTFPNDTKDEGYQIVSSATLLGTTAAEDEMNVKYGLGVSVDFTQDHSVLLTNWVFRMKIGSFFANLMSTVMGFMSIFGSVVMVLEVISTMKLPCANKLKEAIFGKLRDDDEKVLRRNEMYAPVKTATDAMKE